MMDRHNRAFGLARRSFCVPLLLMLALVLFGSGCSSVQRDRKAVALQNATHAYQAALRWGYFENAYGHVQPEQRRNQALPTSLAGLRLTGYDVVKRPSMRDEHLAEQIVSIQYLYEDRQVVKTLLDRQIWQWDPEQKTWWLQSGLPRFE